MEVHHGHDREEIGTDAEEDAEGKSLNQASAHIAIDNRIKVGVERDPVECLLDGGEESLAELRVLGLVPRGRVDQLRFSFGVEANGLHASAA